MTQTTNIGLSQWAAVDYVRREDFNADNAKIDAAMETLYEFPIAEMTTTENLSKLELDLSAVDWSAYRFIWVEMKLDAQNTLGVYVRPVKADESWYGRYITPYEHSDLTGGIAEFHPEETGPEVALLRLNVLHNAAAPVTSECIRQRYYPCWGCASGMTYNDVRRLDIVPVSSGGTILAGARVKVWGTK